MPVSAATLEKLMAAGLQGEELLEIVRSIDADTSSPAKQRSSGAIRQERYRQRHASQNVTSNVTGDASQSVTPPARDIDINKNSNSEVRKELPSGVAKGTSRRKPNTASKAHLCPDDYQPKQRHFDKAAEHGRPPDWVRMIAGRMRSWSHANSSRAVAKKSDWDAALDNFMSGEFEKSHPKTQGARDVPSPSDHLRAAAARLRSEAAYCDDPGEGGGHARMLSGPG